MTDPVFLARTKSFARRARDLPPSLERQYEQVREQYVVNVARGLGYTTVAADAKLDVIDLFGRDAPLVVEVGSGRGEQIVSFAAAHPEWNFLAFEVWTPGIARLAVAAGRAGLTNIRVIEADAQQALPVLLGPDTALELWSFFPDPWRKSRHHKRRLVSAAFAQMVADLLKDGGIWRMATDWEDYAQQMLAVVVACPQFALPDEDEDGQPTFSSRFAGRITTHFEQRAADEGRPVWDLAAVRLPRAQSDANQSGL